MPKLTVVTGLEQLPPAERWSRLVAPLADELAYSGLGVLPDLEELQREVVTRGRLDATEIAVRLADNLAEYGRQLVGRVVAAAGVTRGTPAVPARWRDYDCADYYASPLAMGGYWDEPGQLWLIEPFERVEEEPDAGFLHVGRPGVDGIGFGYRRERPGFWAQYPAEGGRFDYLAPSVGAFLEGWLAGRIAV